MTRSEKFKEFYPLTGEIAKKLRDAELTAAEWRFWAYLVTINLLDGRPDFQTIMADVDIKKSTLYSAIAKFDGLGLLPDSLKVNYRASYANDEAKIRDRLQARLCGFAEITTPAGRIDLLTATEIIEVKKFSDWKSALGQILVYSAFYPEHQKRIHLFGSAEQAGKLADIESSCLAFGVMVTFEIL